MQGSNPSKPVRNPLDDAPELCRLSATSLVEAFRSKSLSPVEVARAALNHAEAINSRFAAFTSIDHEGALAAAKMSEQRWRAESASTAP